jgi:subfamily B ATP-binding cassette protein MsbA
MGKPDATDEQIIEALKMSNAWEFVKDQPDGINTFVGAGGN